jgi:wyosine [tRNA(Phe)-imidazoG37] synthetase (radical SAM superfamily)
MITKYARKKAKHILENIGLSETTIQKITKLSHYNPLDSQRYGFLRTAMKHFPDRKLFCPVPFKRMEIERGGKTCLCCWIRKSPGNLHQDSLMTLWNSPVAQEIRGSILDGTFRYCKLNFCPYYAAGKLPFQKDVAADPYEDIIRNRRTKINTMNLWLSFDHRCNLRCISCRNSNVLLPEKEQTENRALMESVKKALPAITTLGISAKGEPFASPVIRDFLFTFDSATHPNLKLSILTNGQLHTPECWEKMQKAHPAISSVRISIDAATKETYEKIRLGGSFEKLMENLDYLSKLRALNAIGELTINFVVNADNFTEMKDFVKMGFNFNCDYVYFAFMNNWGVFTDEEYKKMAVHRPEHKKHKELNKVLADPLLNDSRVFMRTPSGFKDYNVVSEPIFL